MRATSHREPALQPAAVDLTVEINALFDLDDDALRRRWRRLVGRPLPRGLGRSLTLRILAYYQQAQHFGDLDRGSLRALAESIGKPQRRFDAVGQTSSDARTASERGAPRRSDEETRPRGTNVGIDARVVVRPDALLVREYEGVSHRVMVLEDGFAWDGKTYDSLSKVAFAITGTRWNGPRFFGLRDRPKAGSRRQEKPL